MALITTTAEAKDCLGRLDDEPEQMQFIEDLKKRFPEFSEQLITDVTAKVCLRFICRMRGELLFEKQGKAII